MKKYRVSLGRSTIYRLNNRRVVVTTGIGYDGDTNERIYQVGDKKTFFEFELEDNVQFFYNRTVHVGEWFKVSVEYTNDKGTRKETVELVPELIS